jgi:recombinational DNA repair protein (RecF pathway)
MAKQAGTIKISGTIGDICFYRLHEEHYARTKSTLSAKRVKHDPAFEETMKYAALLACASKIASVIYKQLPKEQKSRKKYQAMTGQAMRLLKEKMNIEGIIEMLNLNKAT